jgi:predicted nucleic acid-binding protein
LKRAGFLDTNILLRYILQDYPDQVPACIQFFAGIEAGEYAVQTLDTVIFECVFTLSGRYGLPRKVVADGLGLLLSLPGILLPNKEWYPEVFEHWVSTRRLSFADAYHLVATKHLGLGTIISFDKGLRGVPGVSRVEPPLG